MPNQEIPSAYKDRQGWKDGRKDEDWGQRVVREQSGEAAWSRRAHVNVNEGGY